jgi:hypothetical protein
LDEQIRGLCPLLFYALIVFNTEMVLLSTVLYLVSIIMAIGMISMYVLKIIVESPPKNIDNNTLLALESLINLYYSGNISIKFYIVLIMGGTIISELVHYLLNFGRV